MTATTDQSISLRHAQQYVVSSSGDCCLLLVVSLNVFLAPCMSLGGGLTSCCLAYIAARTAGDSDSAGSGSEDEDDYDSEETGRRRARRVVTTVESMNRSGYMINVGADGINETIR